MEEIDRREKILIVDREPNDVRLYKLVFRSLFNLYFTDDVDKAYQIIDANNIKVVIADDVQLSSSVINFFEGAKRIHPDVQRILVTGNGEKQFIQDAINKGNIYSYLTKPFEPHRLIIVVEKAIEQYNLQIRNTKLLANLVKSNSDLNQTLEKLQIEEEKFRNIFKASPDPILITNSSGSILGLNQKAEILFGFNQTYNQSNILNLIVAGYEDKMYDYLSNISLSKKKMIEVQMKNHLNTKMFFEINGFPIQYNENKACMIILRDISERKEVEQQILQSIIQTEEKERRWFAQELHDGIGPLLSTTKLYLQWFKKPNAKMDKSLIIDKIEETIEETISGLREISNNISPNTLVNFGLDVALQSFIDRAKIASGIQFNYNNCLSNRIKNELEITIYRILCECINNTLKHANATEITIHMAKPQGILIVDYSDNGKGFDINTHVATVKGSGLLNMKSRIQSLGGIIRMNSIEGQGMRVSLEFNI